MFLDLGGSGTPGGVRFGISDGYGLEANSYHTASTSFQMDSNWHYLVGVCDEAGGSVSLYIDGQLAATGSVAPVGPACSTARRR